MALAGRAQPDPTARAFERMLSRRARAAVRAASPPPNSDSGGRSRRRCRRSWKGFACAVFVVDAFGV